MSDLKSRIEKAVEVLEDNKPLKESEPITKEQLTTILANMGIDDSDLGIQVLEAETTSYDDFSNFACDYFGDGRPIKPDKWEKIAVPKRKFAWSILKGIKKQNASSDVETLLKTMPKPIGQWQDIELLESYRKNCPIEIEEELKKRTHNRPAIIFVDNDTIDIENSLLMIRKARYQETSGTFEVKGDLKAVYKVSEFPLDVFFECPVHSNILLIDGYCEECGKKWDMENYEKNVFLRLIIENDTTFKPFIKLYKDKSFEDLKADFPKVFLKYKDLKDEGKLPSLKRKISKSRPGDPFKVVHTTY